MPLHIPTLSAPVISYLEIHTHVLGRRMLVAAGLVAWVHLLPKKRHGFSFFLRRPARLFFAP
jgi:hypothetical protein